MRLLAKLAPGRFDRSVLLFSLVYWIAVTASLFFVAYRPRRDLIWSAFVYWAILLAFLFVVTQWSRRRNQILLLACSIVLSLGFLEVALRLAFPEASLMPYKGASSIRLHHAMPPERKMFSGYVGNDPIVVRTNPDGLRTPYTRERFLKFKHRIVLLGDSFTFGLNVDEKLIISRRLEAILRERLRTDDLAVLNAGTISYSPFLEKLLFEKTLKDYRPTLTILFLDPTDIGDDQAYMTEYRETSQGKKSGEFYDRGPFRTKYFGAAHKMILKPLVLDPLALPWQIMFPQRAPAYDWYRFNLTMDDGKKVGRWFIYQYPLAQTRKYFEETMANIRELADSCREIQSRFMLCVTPRFHHWSERECPENLEAGGYSNHEPFQFEYFHFFDEQKNHTGFEIFDMLPAFKATNEFPLVFRGDPHWNANGHDFVARTTAEHLLKAGLLP